jgi:hypothetical protein
VHKISTSVNIYMKIGKGKRDKEKKRTDSRLNGPGGDFGPSRARAHAATRAKWPNSACQRGVEQEQRRGRGAHMPTGKGETVFGGKMAVYPWGRRNWPSVV